MSQKRPDMPGDSIAMSKYTVIDGAIVELSPTVFDYPSMVVNYVTDHECGHHINGDTLKGATNAFTGPARGSTPETEYKADCAAVIAGRHKYGYTAESITRIFSYFPPDDNVKTHPSRELRLQNALRCLAS